MSHLTPVRTHEEQVEQVGQHSFSHPPCGVLQNLCHSLCADAVTECVSTEQNMDFTQSFTVLNERLKPRSSTSEQLHLSLNRLEDRESASLRRKPLTNRPTVLSSRTNEDLSDLGSDDVDEDYVSNYLPFTTCLLSELNLKDFSDDNSSTKSEEIDGAGVSSDGDSVTQTPGGGSPFQRDINEGLPDLLKSGRPLTRRRTVGHVSDTLKEVKKEVELTRKRSVKLKARLDKLRGKTDEQKWDKERVTDEVLSVLRLLYPLLEPQETLIEPLEGEKRLDGALEQLQKLSRRLAVSRIAKQDFSSGGKPSEDSAILKQALRDRDEAIEKKQAMEAELLRSRTEMMLLNNQVLEAAQKRLEMSLEVEAWKEDFQLLLHQQVQNQQLAEQAQKKTSRLGILRRNNRAPIQRPSNFPINSPPAQSTAGPSQASSTRAAALAAAGPPSPKPPQRHWMDRLRRPKSSRTVDQETSGQDYDSRRDEGFQDISLN
ncbi:bicaudal-D-related protein 2-like [Gouania willdenowi]|uniref:bicaudal-D-related protein 2-like n=1 Tax=Gouania willdenowi TaxID=441366 RepID=UPI001056D659|nr:uncharacterized protein LOC114475894 [Gouania willdenowi]